jgi:hypothetical protein
VPDLGISTMEDVLADVRRIVEAKRGCLWSVDRQVGTVQVGSYHLCITQHYPTRLRRGGRAGCRDSVGSSNLPQWAAEFTPARISRSIHAVGLESE